MEVITGVGIAVGAGLYGLWTAHKNTKKAIEPVKTGQDAVLEAINLTRKEVGDARVEIHDLRVSVGEGDMRNEERFRAQGERIGRLEDRVSRVEGAQGVLSGGVTGESQNRAGAEVGAMENLAPPPPRPAILPTGKP